MTTTQQPEALRLADLLDADKPTILRVHAEEAGEELRRLHARVQELETQVSKLKYMPPGTQWREIFPIGVLGHPMREYSPGKWESARWPSESRPLTETEINELYDENYSHDQPAGQYFVEIIRMAERAHNIGAE